MTVSLTKGGNVSLTKQAPGMTDVLVGLGWDARTTTGEDFDLDASAIMLTPEGRVLSVFPPDELRQKFDWYCDKLNQDFDFGKVEAIATIGKLKSKPDQARAVISIGLIIGAADGTFDDDERRAVKEACYAVGIAPAEFDL